MSPPFADALAESEEDQVVEWCGRCGFDPAMTVMLLEIHRDPDATVPGESGRPMRAYDFFMVCRNGSIPRYGSWLLRVHSYIVLQFCEDPGQVAALKRMIEDAKAQWPEDP